MIYQSPENPNSHLTVKDRQWPSYPTKQLVVGKLIDGKVLDFGCGTGVDVAFLKENSFDVIGYDPYYAPNYPHGRFDTIICNYVLNVLLPEEQAHVLMAVSELLKPTGRAYFAVRRDITHNGFRINSLYDRKVYQCNVVLPYKSIHNAKHCEIYEYRHFNQTNRHKDVSCPFCNPASDVELVTESATAYALMSHQSQIDGTTFVIPKHHTPDYFELTNRLKTACWLMVDRVKMLLDKRFQPDGYKVSIDIGSAVEPGISHTRIRIAPDLK